MLKYAYYPGCCMHTGAKEYDASWRTVSQALGIELVEMEDWSCCGTVHATNVDRGLSVFLAARNLAIAEDMGMDVVAPCSGCYANLRGAHEAVKTDAALRDTINASLTHPVEASAAIKHPLYVVVEEIGLDAVADPVNPLTGLRVAPYYGCVLTRPVYPDPVDDPENPQALDRLLRTLGADVVSFYPVKTKCCGGAVLLSHPEVAVELSGKILRQAKELGAHCLAVACPMCQMALDSYQARIERTLGEQFRLPVLYFTQLMGLALGVDRARLGLGRLMVSPAKVVELV